MSSLKNIKFLLFICSIIIFLLSYSNILYSSSQTLKEDEILLYLENNPEKIDKFIKSAEKLLNENISTIKKSKKVTLSRNRSLTVKTINYKKFFKLLIVGCISIIALVLLIDTFKNSIKFFIPNIDFYLNNLYQSLIDIKLFITDLLK